MFALVNRVASIGCLVMALGQAERVAAESPLAGKWKLVVLAYGDDEFLLVNVTDKDGKPAAEVVHVQEKLPFLKGATIKSLETDGDQVHLVLAAGSGDVELRGKLVKEGPEAGRVLGSFSFSGNTFPARLEKTDAEKVAELAANPLRQKMFTATQEPDPKTRLSKLEALIAETPGPCVQMIYNTMLRGVGQAETPEAQVREHVKAWLAGAEPYGPAWVNECRTNALRVLQTDKAYAALTLDLAQEAEKSLGASAPLDTQAAILQAIVSAAKLAGKDDLAAATEARLAKVDVLLDEEYHHKVPPFKPEAFAGRQKADANRVVLMELFTGAQCPPCVAADVAFDALLKTYQPAELVALQYHLHIPGPDPLTSPDSVARAQYYGLRSTPSSLFNGAPGSPGGGGMANSQPKYVAYRQLIESQLGETTDAQIDLRVTRSGDKLLVSASAKAPTTAGVAPAAKEGEQPAATPAEPKLRMRLALTEESIRYVGGNKLRFHHHVVRALPGGVEGKELVAGAGQLELTIDLAEIRAAQQSYLDEYGKKSTFPNPLPEIGLKDLSVVAFLQDDADKRVLHAVAKLAK